MKNIFFLIFSFLVTFCGSDPKINERILLQQKLEAFEFLKFSKFFANIAFPPLILMSNNAELSASYLINDVEQTIKNLEITF